MRGHPTLCQILTHLPYSRWRLSVKFGSHAKRGPTAAGILKSELHRRRGVTRNGPAGAGAVGVARHAARRPSAQSLRPSGAAFFMRGRMDDMETKRVLLGIAAGIPLGIVAGMLIGWLVVRSSSGTDLTANPGRDRVHRGTRCDWRCRGWLCRVSVRNARLWRRSIAQAVHSPHENTPISAAVSPRTLSIDRPGWHRRLRCCAATRSLK